MISMLSMLHSKLATITLFKPASGYFHDAGFYLDEVELVFVLRPVHRRATGFAALF